jgi:hypothetical protein
LQFLASLRNELKLAINKGATKFLLYYTGHGHEPTNPTNHMIHGAWVVASDNGKYDASDRLIYLSEVLDAIYKSGFRGGVEITSESCYSGNLCYKAKEWCQDHPDYFEDNDFYIDVSASTNRNRKGTWGKFGRMKKRKQKFGV